MNKEKRVELFLDTGLSDEKMTHWHKEFEGKYPEEHQSFLEWLNIPKEEIRSIRASL